MFPNFELLNKHLILMFISSAIPALLIMNGVFAQAMRK